MFKSINENVRRGALLSIALVLTASTTALPSIVHAASHREAPLISGDPKADATDLYAFVSPDKPDTVTLIANYLPFQNPAGGPNFYAFDDNARYDINIDNDGDAKADIVYRYEFNTNRQNPDTFLYNTGPVKSVDDPNWNLQQTYTLTKIEDGNATVIGENIPTPPSNVGKTSTPNYDELQKQAVKTLGSTTTFAGQSDDPFFADLGGLFDLLTIRNLPGNDGGGIDGLRGFNVQSLALQVPINEVTSNKVKPTDAKDPKAVVGLWTTSSRQSTQVLGGGKADANGEFAQVSRLGSPLVNEVVVPLKAKDLFNSSQPADDAQFANGVTNPELATLLKKIHNIDVPPQGEFGTEQARDDLVAIYLTGIPDLTKTEIGTPSEQLRLNVAVPVTKDPNPLGVIAKDNQGFPNGRRLADDVTDISLQAVAGAAYPLFHPDFKPDPLATKLGDGVPKNDKNFRNTFPYLALPASGFASQLTKNVDSSDDGSGASTDRDNMVSVAAAAGIGAVALVVGAAATAAIVRRRP